MKDSVTENESKIVGIFDVVPLLFDETFYKSQLSHEESNKSSMWEHYVSHGEKAGLQPTQFFDSRIYALLRPDVAAAGINLFSHYSSFGIHEGFVPVDLSSDETIEAANTALVERPEDRLARIVAASGAFLRKNYELSIQLVRAGIQKGLAEQLIETRALCFVGKFDEAMHCVSNMQEGLVEKFPDLAVTMLGEIGHAASSNANYVEAIAAYEALAAAANSKIPGLPQIINSLREARESQHLRYSLAPFLTNSFYLECYPDVRDAGMEPLDHFISTGRFEGRCFVDETSDIAESRILEILSSSFGKDIARAIGIRSLLTVSRSGAGRKALELYQELISVNQNLDGWEEVFEQFSRRIIERWYRFEYFDDKHETLRLLDDIHREFHKSLTLRAFSGLFYYEVSELAAAEDRLAGLHVDLLPEDIGALVRNVLLQLNEVNAGECVRPMPNGLLLLDNSFPSEISSFRFGEFSTYLNKIPHTAAIVRSDVNINRYGESRSFNDLIQSYNKSLGRTPSVVGRMRTVDLGRAKLAYCVFLNLAHLFFSQMQIAEFENLIFTLYPGGGFAPGNSWSDRRLKKILGNSAFSKVITTQNLTYKYLVDGGYCEEEKVLHIFGGIIPAVYTADPDWVPVPAEGKLDVCFVAQRYSSQGVEKGYDVFAQVVRIFSNSPDIHFHVVGGFDCRVIDLCDISNITFYGTQPASFFEDFYRRMHVILSPNIRLSDLDARAPAAFDGFPTTAVVEAGLQGAAMLATDFLGMNQRLDGSRIFAPHELLLIDRDPSAIAAILQSFMTTPKKLQSLRVNGRRAILREFSFERQMMPRLGLLKSYSA